jgi:hypothetical protein
MGVLTEEISVIGKVFPTGPVGTANGDPAVRLGVPTQIDGITVQAKTSLGDAQQKTNRTELRGSFGVDRGFRRGQALRRLAGW